MSITNEERENEAQTSSPVNHKAVKKNTIFGMPDLVVVYGGIALIVSIVLSYTLFFSPSAQVQRVVSMESSRDGLFWNEPPTDMKPTWSKDVSEGYKDIVSTPGAIIGIKESSIERLDSSSGEVVWSYERGDASICDAIDVGGNVVALYNGGNGCSELVKLDAATGQYIRQAQYATDENIGSLVAGNDRVAVVTPSSARLLRSDLVPEAFYGDVNYPTYSHDQSVSGCTISDVTIGDRDWAVASRCDGESTYHVRVIDGEPDESTEGKILLDIDTKSTSPVTTPIMSIAMVAFVVSDNRPGVYVWDLEKDQEEVSYRSIEQGKFGFGHMDIGGFGYVWRIGDEIHVRYGSEDISQSQSIEGAIGNPISVSDSILIPMRNEAVLWNPNENYIHTINVPGITGTAFAFSGKTLVSFDNGIITAFSA